MEAAAGGTESGGAVGLLIVYGISLTATFAPTVYQSSQAEIAMVSTERVLEYTELELEPALEKVPGPPADWPSNGEIRMVNLRLKYSADGPYVLHDISCHILPHQKVGLVGRTGAGKSSLLSAIFRLAEFEGKIEIDGIDTKTVGLHQLRRKIAIIPQDPVLFVGSLRKNLDPFGEYDDAALWKALEQVQLKSAVASLSDGLNTEMQEGGANFSVGQRQLTCLARALLRRTKILVIDEATANVDPNTDAFIQETLKSLFKDCTVLTIAHRINTIIDSDKVLVLEDGHAKEFDTPYNLLQEEDSLFSKFVDEAGPTTSQYLREAAKQKWEEKRTDGESV